MNTLVMTTFDLGRIAEGHDMVVADLDGVEFNVRGPQLSPEAQKNSRNLRQVQLGFDQLRTIATGGTAYGFVEDPPGATYDCLTQIAVRLATLPEYRAALARGKAWFEANGLHHPGDPTDEQILPLITPIKI